MLTGIHAVLDASDAERARAFFRDVLKLRSVDAGDGWLIFALPPAEIAAHPTDDDPHDPHDPQNPRDASEPPPGRADLYLMCDDVERTVAELRRRGVEFTTPIADHGYGLVTTLRIPGAGTMGLYQPKHPSPLT